MKIALVHDYLKEYGGAERVLEALHEIFPEAPIFVAYLDLKSLGPHSDRMKKWNIKTSWFQNFPFAGNFVVRSVWEGASILLALYPLFAGV